MLFKNEFQYHLPSPNKGTSWIETCSIIIKSVRTYTTSRSFCSSKIKLDFWLQFSNYIPSPVVNRAFLPFRSGQSGVSVKIGEVSSLLQTSVQSLTRSERGGGEPPYPVIMTLYLPFFLYLLFILNILILVKYNWSNHSRDCAILT